MEQSKPQTIRPIEPADIALQRFIEALNKTCEQCERLEGKRPKLAKKAAA